VRRQPEPVYVVAYDPQWPRLYEEEHARIVAVLAGLIDGIEHVGSTAVPGLDAKPVIDIMVGVAGREDGERCVAPLEGLGYEYLGEYGIPGRLYFRRGVPRSHQIHMVEKDGEFWERLLLFRDFLRTHSDAVEEYQQLKRELATRFRDDREAYTEAKTAFIRSVEAQARAARGGA
jgi:GrpB-like predicted nucleotidyltransferase (UPF0157 family)